MNHEEFRQAGYKIIDEIVDYYKSCKDGKPGAQVKPGYLANLVDKNIPDNPEPFSKIQQDLHEFIEPGLNHWQASNYFSYYPSTSSYPSMLAEMYSNMFNSQGFDWVCNPAATELEGIVMNWLGELIGLDESFLSSNGGLGCGSIQATASEGNLVSMVAARDRVLKKLNSNDTNGNEGADCSKLVLYASDQAHSSFVKNAKVLKLRYKLIKTDDTGAVQPSYLESQIKEDLEAGLIPCYFMMCVGSTGVSAVDNILGCAAITKEYNLWSHVDAAYAGSFFMLPEFQTYQGFKDCDSILFNPHKLMLVNFDCCGLWVKDKFEIFESLGADASYYTNPATQSGRVIDYKNLQIPLGRRFRSLKLWFVMRSYGKNGLQAHMQTQLDLAKFLVQQIEKDHIFELTHPVPFSLVCFRIKPQPGESLEANNARNEWIFTKVTETRKVIISRFVFKGQTVLRVAIGNGNHSESSISQLYGLLKEYALQVDSNI